ncbi:hypothetical protein HaLaN_13763 [Haematococcus lacustris]|uniref:Uncharacterized protein n=1 Tax=Haematococcus lacustris TaxID=44745 RepID=A0A699Z3K1_HAELA|nr:hypothetical protein HaLaN_13763 [Haematococcus lacustris]
MQQPEPTPAAASEPGPSTPPRAKRSKRTEAEQTALRAKGKEYPGLGYKRLRDKPPKAQQQQQPAVAQ